MCSVGHRVPNWATEEFELRCSGPKGTGAGGQRGAPQAAPTQLSLTLQASWPSGTECIAKYNFHGTAEQDLPFCKGDVLTIVAVTKVLGDPRCLFHSFTVRNSFWVWLPFRGRQT